MLCTSGFETNALSAINIIHAHKPYLGYIFLFVHFGRQSEEKKMPTVTGDMALGACGRIVYCGKQGLTARNCSGDRLNPATGQDLAVIAVPH